jgi:ACS family sodium-dependent inorganic phosphate cotransporter
LQQGGQLADRLGGKRVLAAGLAAWSLATFLTPAAARAGAPQLLLARVALGLGEGVAFPSAHAIIARAVPPAKHSTAVALITGASYCGAALAFLLVPTVISRYGWAASFEGFGAAALLWLPLWLPLRIPTPSSPVASAQAVVTWRESASAAWAELAPLLRTRPVAALCAAQYCGSYGLYGLIAWLPTFFSEQYSIPLAGLPALTVAPYLLQGGVGVLTGFWADAALAAGAPRLQLRRRLQAAGMLLPAAALVAAASPAAAGSPVAGAVLIDLGLAASALTLGGVSVNHLDIAPRHAGAVFGAGNTAATLAGLVAVPLTGAILDATGSWAFVFGVTAAHYVVGAALYWAWAGAEPLPEDGGAADAAAPDKA